MKSPTTFGTFSKFTGQVSELGSSYYSLRLSNVPTSRIQSTKVVRVLAMVVEDVEEEDLAVGLKRGQNIVVWLAQAPWKRRTLISWLAQGGSG